ncbi:Poly(A) RNA polymerase, mitochondrial [Ooceraea biroi]|uniref:Poly(A) RNA polymerase, mitochondrial n=1 Tax=Ooceraea biroi TaxID=2015173 RepID=A0A026VZ68_OOCBI|nr:Poly(A) RNA polymerase, mitochondrial [Ooceraea biroi]
MRPTTTSSCTLPRRARRMSGQQSREHLTRRTIRYRPLSARVYRRIEYRVSTQRDDFRYKSNDIHCGFVCATRASCTAESSIYLKMALFSRANVNSFSLLYRCCKFSTGNVKFKSQDRILVSPKIQQNKARKQNNETVELDKSSPFDKEVIRRRDQACRSILVQVQSTDSYYDLQNYCIQFGYVLSMHHYQISKQHNYILVEFKNIESVKEIISHASLVNEDVIGSAKSSVFWFHKRNLVTSNNQKSNQRKLLFTENGCALLTEEDVAKLLYNAKSISGQIIDLYEMLKLDELETRLRFHTACHLEQCFSGFFQNMRVLPFGSSVNGFGRKRCDVDLVIVPDDTKKLSATNRLVFHTKPLKRDEKHEIKEFLGAIANAMHYFVPGTRSVRKILEARVPIIKFNYEYTHLECDLSTTNMSAVYMSELLYLYGEIDWRVRPLVMAIRQWARHQDVTSDSPGFWITNFSLTLMVLFYLQQKDILPSLNTLRLHATHNDIRYTKNGIDCTFLRDIKNLPHRYTYQLNQSSLEELFYGFFEYYSQFDFQKKGICIREGVPIRKPSHAALYITNPLETTLNVSRNVDIREVNHIIQKAYDAIYALETTNKSVTSCWGFMALLNMKTDSNIKGSKMKEEIQNFSRDDHSYEDTDKYEVNGIDSARSEVQEKETKEIV